MASNHNLSNTLLLLAVLFVVLPSGTYAFGAGDIPDFAYLNDKAFRHGDIENVLGELVKSYGHARGGGLLSIASSFIGAASQAGGAKFNKDDVKKVYFGNWLRDYSQAMDIAGLEKLTADTIVLIVSVLGFMTFGFATEEFEVTPARLGVYLPVEHIDNPKGYGEKEGDARQFHPKLRPPVQAEELEIDLKTGMKNYMATENKGWDTSTAHIRRAFRACIDHGRRARGKEGPELWEAYRLLGMGLHTMEDLLAHSNWCEIALRKMGYSEVFCHVGDRVVINTPDGPAPPVVTGTFGSADFMHSLMGEATDHLSQASVVDLSAKMSAASSSNANSFGDLKNLLSSLPFGIGGDSDTSLHEISQMHEESKAYSFDPNKIASPEVQKKLLRLLVMRDNIFRQILRGLESIPGLTDLIDSLTNALNAYVYTILAPYLTPLLQQVSGVLSQGSQAIIDTDDQYEVFNNPNASDPSHSLLSKDHFALVLNEPAGKIALVVVRYSVDLIVRAWSEDLNPDQIIDQVLEAFHHPYYATGRSNIQDDMFQEMEKWVEGLEDRQATMAQLTKESVRAGRNKRQGADDDLSHSHQVYEGSVPIGNYAGATATPSYETNDPQPSVKYENRPSSGALYPAPSPSAGYTGGGGSGASYAAQGRYEASEENYSSGGYVSESSQQPSYGRTEDGYKSSENTHGSSQSTYGSSQNVYGQHHATAGGYAGTQGYGSSQTEYNAPPIGVSRPSEHTSYGSINTPQSAYGRTGSAQAAYGQTEPSYGRTEVSYESSYGRTEASYAQFGPAYGRTEGQVAPSYAQPLLSYVPPVPTYAQPAPAFVPPVPSYDPSYGRTEPASVYQSSGYGSVRRPVDDEGSYGTQGHRHGEADSFYDEASVQESFSRMSVNESSANGRSNQGYEAPVAYPTSVVYPTSYESSAGRAEGYVGAPVYGGEGAFVTNLGYGGGYAAGEIAGGYGGGGQDRRRSGDHDGGRHHRRDSRERRRRSGSRDSSEERREHGHHHHHKNSD
ncbi:hypothetical protein EUX98_g3548 [Antrodiella citrinella]|uniref:Het-C-domain-containing protein n=1 Tax=Antrodiella citrinella TaxID=2447956 RepID=A0A4S4MW82_9APHY|nr:hypothetical protein EUX98_g3548 [Antrodiella citrinella]